MEPISLSEVTLLENAVLGSCENTLLKMHWMSPSQVSVVSKIPSDEMHVIWSKSKRLVLVFFLNLVSKKSFFSEFS